MKAIPLTQGYATVVDDDAFEVLNQFKWYAKKASADAEPYAARGVRNKDGSVTTIRMHRYIACAKEDEVAHHKNEDTLDNRRENLECITRAENMRKRWKKN